MEELNNVTTDVAEMNGFEDLGSTDLVPVEATSNSEGGVDAGSVALGALAIVGAGFILKKAWDGGKWVVGKIKNRFGKSEDADADAGNEAEEPKDEESEPAAEETETSKPSDKKAKK